MKILFITNNLPPIVDGVGDYTYNIAKQFAAHKHEVYIICKHSQEINVEVSSITILPIINKWNFNCYKSIVKLIKEKSMDVVSLQYVPHGFHPKGLPFPIIKLTSEIKRCNTKLFTFFHEVGVEPIKGNIKRTLLSKLMLYITKLIIHKSDYIATSIEYYQKMLLDLGSLKNINIPIIPIASNIPETKLSNDELSNLKQHLAPNNELIISFFGIRDISTSIETITKLKEEGYKIKTLIIGKTSNKIQCILPDDTIKTGILDINEIDKYFKISDVFILPQDNHYGCSFKSGSFATAIRTPLPIITSKGCLTSNILVDKVNICFIDFSKKEEIYTAIKSSLNDEYRMILKSNIAIISNNVNWESTYNNYINTINHEY